MNIVNVKLNYPSKPSPDGKSAPKAQDLTLGYISFAVSQKYKEGLESQFRRIWARIETKFDKAIDEDLETIELETGEIDFIKGAFKDCKFPHRSARFVTLLEDEMDNWGKTPKTA